jgi:hypothetical protein
LVVSAGVTYYFFVQNFDGTLAFNVREVAPPAEITVRLKPFGLVANGNATVAGKAYCSRATTALVDIDLTQSRGHSRIAHGTSFGLSTSCSPNGVPWTAVVVSSTATQFGAGLARAHVTATTCEGGACRVDEGRRLVGLLPRR